MKISILLAVAFTLTSAVAGGEGWSRNFEAARKQAAAEGKDLLLDFTGSDWCSWCIKLNKEVFAHEAFKTGVKSSFVLVELDYPHDKTKIAEEELKQNEALLKTYPIKGYPTILLCDSAGKPFAATGYRDGGPEKYVEHLAGLRAKKTARDEAFAKAGAATGVEQANLWIAALGTMELDEGIAAAAYPEIGERIRVADPRDETGFSRKATARQKLADFRNKLGEVQQQRDTEKTLTFLDAALAEADVPEDLKQHIHGHKAAALMHASRPDEALRTLEAGIKVAPDSPISAELGKFADFVRKQLEQKKAAPEQKDGGKPGPAAEN